MEQRADRDRKLTREELEKRAREIQEDLRDLQHECIRSFYTLDVGNDGEIGVYVAIEEW